MPRALLVCCEGKTEEQYFNILLDFYRLPAYVDVRVYGQRGQHIALVDTIDCLRSDLCAETGYDDDEVECWAVCDEDQMPCTYAELHHYAEEKSVHLAFSAPQFEMYLLQHFEQSNETNQTAVFQKLSRRRNEYGAIGKYDSDTKADLSWIRNAIDQKPKIVDVAITNSNIRDNTTKRPFFTVQ